MAHLFKPTYTKVDPATGERTTKTARKWYVKYTDASGVTKRVPLCEDKTASQAMLADLMRTVEREIAGILDSSTTNLKKPIDGFVCEYERHLEVKARSERHVTETIRLIRKVLGEIGCSVIGELQSAEQAIEDYLGRRMDSGSSHRTINADLVAVRSFCRWLMQKKKCLTVDPTLGLEKLNVDEDRRHERRALTDEETQRLIQTTIASPRVFRELTGEDRAMIYMLAQRTGLRRGELVSLKPSSFDFTGANATVTVNAERSKRRKLDVLPIPQELVATFRQYLSRRPTTEPVWPGTWWERSSKMLKLDLQDAGIEPVDEAGRHLDFHGQRTTFITSLARAGVSPATAQKLARHSDVNLTLGTYTKLQAGELNEALERLPALANQPSVPKTPSSETVASPIDAELASVVAAWPSLRRAIRKAILALIETT